MFMKIKPKKRNNLNFLFWFSLITQTKIMHKLIVLAIIFLLIGCNSQQVDSPETKSTLPFIGRTIVEENGDSTHHQVGEFSFINQNKDTITESYLKGKITIVDYFFTTCPTICPAMTSNMVEVQKKWKSNELIQFLSHTVDPETDTPNKLKRFATNFKADTSNWHFVTGNKEDLYSLGFHSYMVTADKDDIAPGGFIHSSLFILVDQNLHIRGIYDGTKEEEINKLNNDISILLDE